VDSEQIENEVQGLAWAVKYTLRTLVAEFDRSGKVPGYEMRQLLGLLLACLRKLEP